VAVPNPERELKRLEQKAKAGLDRVTIITGASTFFRGEALEFALAAVPKGRDLRSIDGQQDTTDGRELQLLRGAGLFGGGTWLVVRRAENWLAAHGEELARGLDAVSASCGLILDATKFDKRTKIGKALAARDLYEFRELYAEPYDRSRSPLDAELIGFVTQRSRALGVPVTAEAAFVLVATVGKDLGELVGELRRLAERLGAAAKTKPLTPDALRGQLTCSFESTPFEFAEALLERDRARCLRSLAAMFARGVKGRDGSSVDRGGVFPFVTSWLHQSLANAHRGRCLLDRGVPASEIAAQAGVRTFADRYVLHETQRRLRASGEDPQLLLESMLARYFAGERR
jgi:DNA polymerase III delta subunit